MFRDKLYFAEAYFPYSEKPSWLYSFFDGTYQNEQLSAVVFGSLNDLTYKQCCAIGDKRRSRFAWYILNAFMSGASIEQVSQILAATTGKNEERRKQLSQFRISTTYRIDCGDHTVTASRDGDYLIGEDGQRYKIGYDFP